MIFNPLLFVFVVVELFDWFQNDLDSGVFSRIDVFETIFVGVYYQVEVVDYGYKVVCPFYINSGVELGFQYIKTTGKCNHFILF
jgi:hypothetical protein